MNSEYPVIGTGLWAHWRLLSSSDLTDASGNSHPLSSNGTLVNGAMDPQDIVSLGTTSGSTSGTGTASGTVRGAGALVGLAAGTGTALLTAPGSGLTSGTTSGSATPRGTLAGTAALVGNAAGTSDLLLNIGIANGGWTVPVASVDTRIIYVDPAGNDANDGLSQATAKRTIANAGQL